MKKLIVAGIALALLPAASSRAEEPAPKSNLPSSTSALSRPAAMKVLVSARVNNGSTTSAAPSSSPAPGNPPGGPARGTPPGGAPARSTTSSYGGYGASYTHTNSKSLSISLVNTTRENLELKVNVTFMAQDQGAKHEIVPEKTVESQRTVAAGKSDQFTTEEVSFTHTTAHREMGKPGGAQGAPPQAMTPASGHIYAGYKIEVFQGTDLVGSSTSGGSIH